MGFLADLRQFLGKYLSNPILIAGIAFIISKLVLSKRKEAFTENIRVVYRKNKDELIYDDVTASYIVIHDNRKIHKVGSEQEGRKMIDGGMYEKLDLLHESIKR